MTDSEFESLIRKHQAMVYSIALHFFRNAATAEEVAQDVFLQLYQEQESKSDLHTVSWLRRTTAHRCIDRLRRRSVQREVQMDEVPEILDSSRESDPLLERRMWRLIGTLPEKQRMILILRYGEDMDVDEIARTLQMPARTVWSHLRRSLALLREKAAGVLRKEDYEPVGK